MSLARLEDKKSPAEKKFDFAPLSILVCDSSVSMLKLYKEALGGIGFGSIYTTREVAEAKHVMADSTVDMIVMDVVDEHDKPSGLLFLKELRRWSDDKMATLPVIVASSRVTPQQVVAARDAGMNEFLIKPFSVGSLFRSVARIVEDPKAFVRIGKYIGPCRRRRALPINAPDRRRTQAGVIPAAPIQTAALGAGSH
ncbi:response regulator [Roseiterribacter gracilis]|uniref:Response regulator n=1 Tax=Roseiterribacter gracilis TaxID=2812848 RepID=A0A8S8XKR3_9PROT|nr:response regulator [Rhodospirillales bacterium TMPK1]